MMSGRYQPKSQNCETQAVDQLVDRSRVAIYALGERQPSPIMGKASPTAHGVGHSAVVKPSTYERGDPTANGDLRDRRAPTKPPTEQTAL
jgi:hypothetical protein